MTAGKGTEAGIYSGPKKAPQELAEMIEGLAKGVKAAPKYSNQLEVTAEASQAAGLLTGIKQLGFEHLSNITCVDWIMRNTFDVTYNLWSYGHRVHAVVKVSTPRDNPRVQTIHHLWPQAQVYEQELHEMFGVDFPGNPNLGPLFLHNWQDIPPLRKDFDTERYSREAYGMLDDEEGEA